MNCIFEPAELINFFIEGVFISHSGWLSIVWSTSIHPSIGIHPFHPSIHSFWIGPTDCQGRTRRKVVPTCLRDMIMRGVAEVRYPKSGIPACCTSVGAGSSTTHPPPGEAQRTGGGRGAYPGSPQIGPSARTRRGSGPGTWCYFEGRPPHVQGERTPSWMAAIPAEHGTTTRT